jgi:hypothetical protein
LYLPRALHDLVHEMSREPDFLYLLDLAKPDKRRKDVELALRFCAFFNATHLKYRPPMNFIGRYVLLGGSVLVQERLLPLTMSSNIGPVERQFQKMPD